MKKRYYFEMITLFFYASVTFVWLFFHEPWRDEAQAWLIARDLNLFGVIKQMHWEGGPGLWHLLLFFFAKLGFPYFSEFILHWIIGVVAIGIFLFKAPFYKLFKLVFVFSYYLAYEYILIARNYNLTILLLFIIASLYDKRFKHNLFYSFLILLLFNANIYSSVSAGLLTLLFIWESFKKNDFRKQNIIAILIMITGGLLVLLQTRVPQNSTIHFSFSNFNPIFIAIGNAFLPNFNSGLIGGYFLSIILILLLFEFLRQPKILLFFALSVASLFLIFILGYEGQLWHHGLIIIFLIFSLWLKKYYRNDKIKKGTLYSIGKIGYSLFVISLLFSIISSVKAYKNEYLFNFSGGKEAASYIKKNISSDKVIIAYRSYASSSLLPYLPNYKFWYADKEKFGSFITWDKKFIQNAYCLSNQDVIGRANKKFGEKTDKIFLLTKPLSDSNFELLYQTSRDVFSKFDEVFYIYREKHEN